MKLPKMLRKPFKISKSAVKQQLQERIENRWKEEWSTSPRRDKIKHIEPTPPISKIY